MNLRLNFSVLILVLLAFGQSFAAAPVLSPFTSDGCSRSPDGMGIAGRGRAWVECCVAHDTIYWLGGTLEDKQKADEDLQICIADKGYPKVAKVYRFFVNKYGGPETGTSYRWGYGWNYERQFSPITEEEDALVQQMYGVPRTALMPILVEQTLQEGRFKAR